MAGGQERKLKRRIKSVQSTKKITRAMELIAASRIVKAQQAIFQARPYLEQMQNVVADVADAPDAKDHRLFKKQEADSDSKPGLAIIAIAGDRGLSGGYNGNIVKATERAMKERAPKGSARQAHLVAVGRKVEGYFKYRNQPIEGAVTGVADRPTFSDAQRVVKTVNELFESGKVDEVVLVYTRFISAGTQRVTARQLVPMERPSGEHKATSTGHSASGSEHKAAGGEHKASGSEHKSSSEHTTVDFEYEPDPSEILDRLLPRWLEAEVFTAMLEAAASEHAARQSAMKAATDNAEELITSLTRVMNRARQAAITTEIMEIVGGAEALRAATGEAQSFSEIYVPPTPNGAHASHGAGQSHHSAS